MRKVLIAVNDTRASKAVLSTFLNSVQQPEEVVLLHVEKLEGRSLMIDMLGEAEMSTLKDDIKGTEYKESLDRKATKILDYYAKELKDTGSFNIKTVIRDGIPAEEILKTAEEESAELIILGYGGKKGINRIIAGDVAGDVSRNAKVPVLMAKRVNICAEPYSWGDALAAVSVTSAVIFCLFLLGIILHGGKFVH